MRENMGQGVRQSPRRGDLRPVSGLRLQKSEHMSSIRRNMCAKGISRLFENPATSRPRKRSPQSANLKGDRASRRKSCQRLPNVNTPQFHSVSLKPSFAGRSSHLDLEIPCMTALARGGQAARAAREERQALQSPARGQGLTIILTLLIILTMSQCYY